MLGEKIEHVGNAVAVLRRDHERALEGKQLVCFLREPEQSLARHEVDLVEDQDFLLRNLREPVDDHARLVVETLLRIDQERRDVGIGRARHHHSAQSSTLMPGAASAASAAARWASRFVAPSPSPDAMPCTSTAIRNTGLWSGPLRST